MELCLVRHAIAGERDPERYPDDALRPVTRQGASRMRDAAEGLKSIFTPEAIVSSPLLRATQTAKILVAAYGLEEMTISEGLASGLDQMLFTDVEKLHCGRVIVVGHEPHLSRTVSNCLSGSPDRVQVTIKKGAAVLITFEGAPVSGEASSNGCCNRARSGRWHPVAEYGRATHPGRLGGAATPGFWVAAPRGGTVCDFAPLLLIPDERLAS